MSAHEDDGSTPCERCGVTFDVHAQLGCGREPRMAYVGRKNCGCPVAAIVIDGTELKRSAKEIAAWVRSGMTVEQRSVEWVRKNLHRCRHAQESLPAEGRS